MAMTLTNGDAEKSSDVSRVGLRGVFRANCVQFSLTYTLLAIENLLRLAQPLVLGWAINDLLRSSYDGLYWFVGQHVAHLLVGTLRQMYDTRVFTSIYTNLATHVVSEQRENGETVSRIAARSAMSRHYVEFFEHSLPMLLRAGFSIIGAIVFLAYFDVWLVAICLGLVGPACLLNYFYGQKTLWLSQQLHNEYEREISAIEQGEPENVRDHYQAVAGWRVRLSDAEALNFSLTEFFVLGVFLLSLIRFCSLEPAPASGDIFAVFRYVLMFVMGMDSLPRLTEQISRLKDIGRRMTPGKRRRV